MITKKDLNEAAAIVGGVIKALIGTARGGSGDGGSLVYDGGVLLATLAGQIAGQTITQSLANLFEETRTNGGTYVQFEALRNSLIALAPTGLTGIAIQIYSIQLCLVEQSQIISSTTFVTRVDIDAAIDTISAAFDQSLEIAATAFDSIAFTTLLSLAAVTIQYLTSQAILLPQVVYFSFPQVMSSLYLSQRIYQDGTRERELALENQAVHPLFIPSPIRALSS
jgi:prophage DNA circulation protein